MKAKDKKNEEVSGYLLRGYKEGREEGYKDGYKDGHKDGKLSGYEKGLMEATLDKFVTRKKRDSK